ncbi:M24 family metallopeptidase [Undibacterium sp. Di26W]|uniref:M24 family metallopeptidase n=1 Tax=Undibacterium sp. Di26W TaxID=3413035 RepID=UPI003BF3AF2F
MFTTKAIMPTETQIEQHRVVQAAAKAVLERLAGIITAKDTEQSIADKAYAMLCECGYADTWYHQCPALVLLGSRSCVSISGRDYQPGTEQVGSANLITVDLSPTNEQYWGDCARSFPVENGMVTHAPQMLEFRNGLSFLKHLHAQMPEMVTPKTTFGQLFDWANLRIRQNGFVNLDYRNNVGHSIVINKDDREFIHSDNKIELGEVPFFSFEPFIRLKGGKWGFKHEGIFYFNAQGRLEEL